jgi:putative colanic acid biosynthesis acetyltransferase WcaF
MPQKTQLVRRQKPGEASPWPLKTRLAAIAWEAVWSATCRWTPKPFNGWRLVVMRAFGAKIIGRPFVHQRARIQLPWNVELHDRACAGDRANLYSLDRITIGAGAIVAQEAYLCAGTHDFSDRELPVLTGPIVVGARAFIGARAFVLPGVTIGEAAVVGASAVVTKDVPAGATVAGNPARTLS